MSTLVCAEEGATGAYSYDAPTLRHSGTQGAPYLHWSRPRWCMERRRLHLGYRSHSDCPGCRSLWGEQDRHRRCEHHRLVSTPNDRQSKPSTVGTSHDASWTRQGLHGICKPRGANPSNCPPKRLKPSELRAVDHAAPRDRDVQLSPAADRLWHMLWPASWPTRHHQKNQI